ncbi:hypothetical protein Tco_1391851 [Tanacetum coccineum]
MVAKNTKKTPQDSASKQFVHGTKHAPPKKLTPVKPTKPAPVKQTKPPSSKLPKSPKKKPSKITPSRKVHMGKPSLVDEEDEAKQEPEPQGECDDPAHELAKKLRLDAHQEKGEGEGADTNLEQAIKLSLDPSFLPQRQAPVGGVAIHERVAEEIQRLPDVDGKGKAIVTEEKAAHSLIDLSKKKSTTDQFILQRRDQAPHDLTTGPSSQPQDNTSEKVVHESSSIADLEQTKSETEDTAPKVDKEQGEVTSTIVTSGVGISVRTENQAGSDPGQGHEALAGSNLEPMQEDSGPGKEHVALAGPNPEHMDEDFYATAYPKVHENLKLRTDEHVILENPESSSATLSSMKNLDETDNFGDQFLNDKPTEDDQEKTNVVDETDSIIPDPSHQTNTSAPPVTTPVINISSPKPSSQVNAPPINTEATTIITTIPEITPFIALQLRVAKLEQDMSEVKKTDHSAAVLASIQSQVPTVVDKYLGTKVDDALLKALEKHTADLIQKYSGLPAPESSKKQESEKSPEEILRIKREQEEQKHVPTYTIKSTDTTIYHAIMEALLEDENAMDKEVADKVKDHKRKRDSDDDEDDDDEGPSAGSNQGKKKLCKADLEGPTFNLVKAFHNSSVSLQFQMDECHKLLTDKVDLVNPEGHQILRNVYESLPLEGPPAQSRSIPRHGLEELVTYLWVERERDYDISAAYGITHWWFSRKVFYISKHREPSDRDAVRSRMRILSVISIKTYERYGYNYLREIVLRRADYKEYKIS